MPRTHSPLHTQRALAQTEPQALQPASAPGGLAVVVLTMNLPDDTLACVQSLLADGFAPTAIIVVDNGSTTGRAELARGLPRGVGQIYLPENAGFAAGNNAGIVAALRQGAEWVLLLNNDTLVQPGCRAALLAAMHSGAWDVLSPLVLYAHEPARIWALGDRRVLGTLLTRSLHRNRLAPTTLAPVIEVDFVTGCALLVRAAVLRQVGLLDQSYFPIYAEDADFCLRAQRAGFRLAGVTTARILHKVSRTTGFTNSRGWRIANQAYYYRRHAGWAQQAFLLAPFTLIRALLMAGRALLARRPQAVPAILRGWQRGWFGPLPAPQLPQPPGAPAIT